MKVSKLDIKNLSIIRSNVDKFIEKTSIQFDIANTNILDIAPQDYEGAAKYYKKTTVKTFDIDPNSNADYIGDICKNNSKTIPDNAFDYVLCTEVLEHVLNPFDAILEIRRMLKTGGYLFMSTPFNFRIHGPLPDCWRFTEHGLRELLKEFKSIEISQVESKNRFLMPVHYTVIAQK